MNVLSGWVEMSTGEPGVQLLVLSPEGTNVLDTTSADMLGDLVTASHQQGVDVDLVRVRYPVRRVLRRRSGVMEMIGEDHLWHSISQEVKRARRAHGHRWSHLRP